MSGKTRPAVSAVVVAVALAVGVAFAVGGSDDEDTAIPVGRSPTPSTVLEPSPARKLPATTAPPATAPVEPGITSKSRISFDGVGPVRFGQAPEQAAAAARAVIRPLAEGCFDYLDPGPGTDLAPGALLFATGYGTNSIEVLQIIRPGLTTGAGIGVGSSAADLERAYPNADRVDNGAGWETFRISGPSGREIEFGTENGSVRIVLWGTSRAQIDDSLRC